MPSPKPSGLARFTRQGATPRPSGGGGTPGNAADGSSSTRPDAPAVPADSIPAAGREASKAKLVGVYLMPDGHRQLKIEAAKRGATVSDLVREALNTWFANEHLPPLA